MSLSFRKRHGVRFGLWILFVFVFCRIADSQQLPTAPQLPSAGTAPIGTAKSGPPGYFLGSSVSFVGNYGNALAGNLSGSGRSYLSSYSVNPSVSLRATGFHYALDGAYALGWNHGSNPNAHFNNQSHLANVGLASSLGSAWRFNLRESYISTADDYTFNNSVGNPQASLSSAFVVNPVVSQFANHTNNASGTTDFKLDDSSGLRITVAHSLREYNNQATQGILANQQRLSGSFGYNRRTSIHDTWTFTYSAAYLNFSTIGNAGSQAVNIGYSTELSQNLTLQLAAGASRISNRGTTGSYVGYDTSATVKKVVQDNTFMLSYNQNSGQSSGVGYVSDVRRGIFNYLRGGKIVFLSADASAFDTRGRLGTASINAIGTFRGAQAAVSGGFHLSKDVSLQVGGQYQRYSRTAILGFTQKRLYVTLRLSKPDLWKDVR